MKIVLLSKVPISDKFKNFGCNPGGGSEYPNEDCFPEEYGDNGSDCDPEYWSCNPNE
jgi:hypothetical protein